MLETLLFASLSFAPPQTPTADSLETVRRQADAAAARYESAIGRYAPEGPGFSGRTCDERVGRFCLRFTPREQTPPDTVPEHPAVVEARSRALRAHRAWFDVAPEREPAAAPLVRYLIEQGRAGEAVEVARAHVAARDRPWESLLLLGMALHAAGSSQRAERIFDEARSSLPAAERTALDDVGPLLEPGERRRYGGLPPEERSAYEARFWRFSDPSLLVPGNERRAAHYARHAWSRVLAGAPSAVGRASWGWDMEELVIRYGVPVHRERVRPPPARPDLESVLVEHQDRHAVSFVPAALLTEGLPGEPEPGEPSALEAVAVRSSYAPVRLHRVAALSVQSARVPVDGGWALVVSGRLEPDPSLREPAAPRAALVLLDTLGRELVREPAAVWSGPDGTTWVRGEVPVAPGRWVYRLEVVDRTGGRLGVAQYPVRVEAAGELALSDLLVADPAGADAAHRDAVLMRDRVVEGGAVRVWAEVRRGARGPGLGRYEVEWWIESAEEPSVLGRAMAWVARRLGAGGADAPVRVRWEAEASTGRAPLSLVLDLAGLDVGLYRVNLELRDIATGTTATSSRLIRVSTTAPPPPVPRPDPAPALDRPPGPRPAPVPGQVPDRS